MIIQRIFLIIMVATIMPRLEAIAQAPDTVWTRTFGGSGMDDGFAITKISDSEFILGGYTDSYGNGAEDVWLLKVNTYGDSIWTRTLGSDDHEFANDVCITNEGGFLITGQKGDFPFWCRVLTIKTDNMGNEVWSGIFGGCFAEKIKPTSDSGYVSVGCTPWYWYLLRYDSSGDTLWTRTYSDGYNNYCYDVKEYQLPYEDGYNFMMVGITGAGSYDYSWDAYFLRVDSLGEVIQSRRYGDPAYGPDDWAASIEPTSDGNFIVAGSTETFGVGGWDVWLMKFTPDGDTIWTRTYGGPEDDCGGQAIETEDLGFIIVGYTESFGHGAKDVYIIKTDSSGDTLWTKTIGGSGVDCSRRIVPTGKGEYIMVGYTESFGAGQRDIYLIKLASDQVDIESLEQHPTEPDLYFCYPNPFNASTTIKYELPSPVLVKIEIYDILGRKVSIIDEGLRQAGYHQLEWSPADLVSGVYFYRLQAGDFSDIKKMILVK